MNKTIYSGALLLLAIILNIQLGFTAGFKMGSRSLEDVMKESNELDADTDFKSKMSEDEMSMSNGISVRPHHAQLNKNKQDLLENNKIESLRIQDQFNYLLMSVIAGCTIAAILAIIAGAVCWLTVARSRESRFETKNSIFNAALGSSGSNGSIKSKSSTNSGDRRLAQSAQMFHYQHQKQQMIAMEKANNETKPENSDDDSEGETEEGDYTVYECPGLAPTGEMEVKNPLFKEDFSVSSNNIIASSHSISSMPPPYSAIENSVIKDASIVNNLIEINETSLKQQQPKQPELVLNEVTTPTKQQ